MSGRWSVVCHEGGKPLLYCIMSGVVPSQAEGCRAVVENMEQRLWKFACSGDIIFIPPKGKVRLVRQSILDRIECELQAIRREPFNCLGPYGSCLLDRQVVRLTLSRSLSGGGTLR